MKVWSSVFVLWFLPQTLFALSLGDLEKRLQQHQIYQVQFTQKKTIPFLKKPFVSSGFLVFHHKKGIFWNSTKPLSQSLVISPKGIFEVKGNIVEALTGGGSTKVFSAQLFEFFSGDFASLQKNFALQLSENSQGYKVKLTPKGTSLQRFLKSISLELDSQGKLTQIQIFEANQSSSRILLGSYKNLKELGKKERLVYDQIQN